MAWNEPGGDNKDNDRDPWSGKPRKQGKPSDLDKLLSDFHKKVTGVIGGKDKKGENPPPIKSSGILLFGIIVFLLLIWFFLGFFKVQEAEKAVILRFGAYSKTLGAGLHWIPPLIDSHYKVDVQQRNAYTYSAKMLTKDENIVSVSVAVQYRKADPEAYLFNVIDPVESLEQATASALRQTVGNMKLDDILTTERDLLSENSAKLLEILMKKYAAGIEVTTFTLDTAKPPEEVQEAFDDVNRAGQDKERYTKKAEAYAAQVTKEASGNVERITADASAYQQKVVLNAQTDIANFLALLPEYMKSPEVTRERMYISTMEKVLRSSSKVIVDVKSNNLVYLPLDKIIPQKAALPKEENVDIKADVSMPISPKPVQVDSTKTKGSTEKQTSNAALDQGYLSFSRAGRQGYSSGEENQ